MRQSLLSGIPAGAHRSRRPGVLKQSDTDPRAVATSLEDFASRIEIDVRSANPRGTENTTPAPSTPLPTATSTAFEPQGRGNHSRPFIEETLGGKREGAAGAQKFLATQIKEYETALRVAEEHLAEFKKSNIGLMPTEQGGYFTQLQTELDLSKNPKTI